MTDALPPVCILAGGLGTRLGALTKDLPKALIDVNGEPFLNYQLRELARQGVSSVVLCVGHLGESVEETIGHRSFGLDIAYSYDGPNLNGTLGAIRRARHLLDDRFFVLYGDTILAIDYALALSNWNSSKAPAFMSVLRNAGERGPSNARVDSGFVAAYDKRTPDPEMTWIDYGLSGLSKDLLDRTPQADDLADLWTVLAREHLLAAFVATERFYEIGSPEALNETRTYLAARDARRDQTNEDGA